MILITVTLIPSNNPMAAEEIGNLTIANTGQGTDENAEYAYRFRWTEQNGGIHHSYGNISGHNRRWPWIKLVLSVFERVWSLR